VPSCNSQFLQTFLPQRGEGTPPLGAFPGSSLGVTLLKPMMHGRARSLKSDMVAGVVRQNVRSGSKRVNLIVSTVLGQCSSDKREKSEPAVIACRSKQTIYVLLEFHSKCIGYEAVPAIKLAVAVGACGRSAGISAGSHPIVGPWTTSFP
jgi:hypothetical protein